MRLFSWGQSAILNRALTAERACELETTRANLAAHRVQELESDLATLQGQHANTLKGNETIAGERDAAVRELKVRADLILQHGRTIAELQKQLAAAQADSLTRANRANIDLTAALAKIDEHWANLVKIKDARIAELEAEARAELVELRLQNEKFRRETDTALASVEDAKQHHCRLVAERDAAIAGREEARGKLRDALDRFHALYTELSDPTEDS